MAHRTAVLLTSHGFVGKCSCGWVTPKRDADRSRIQIMLNDHELEAIGVDPRQLSALGEDAGKKK